MKKSFLILLVCLLPLFSNAEVPACKKEQIAFTNCFEKNFYDLDDKVSSAAEIGRAAVLPCEKELTPALLCMYPNANDRNFTYKHFLEGEGMTRLALQLRKKHRKISSKIAPVESSPKPDATKVEDKYNDRMFLNF